MRLSSPWVPRLSDPPGTPSERLAKSLGQDIVSGALPPGTRLPPHREIAWKLGVSIGSVTKAMTALERRGLVRGVNGRGTFVSGQPVANFGGLDLSTNVPPSMISDRLLAESLRNLARRLDAGTFTSYAPLAGRKDHRRALAHWLEQGGLACSPDRIILCNGAQHAISLALAAACDKGSALLTEALTYPGALAVARARRLQIRPIEMDEEGILPPALGHALSERGSAARHVVYLTPTLQNPTAATMGLERRKAITDICGEHDALIVEDDIHGAFRGKELPPIAALAPQRTIHVTSLSKVLSPGLRIGSLVLPECLVDRAMAELAATSSAPPIVSCMIMAEWLADGTAREVAGAIVADSAQRFETALACLPTLTPSLLPGFHTWLPMEISRAERIRRAAGAAGIIVPSPYSFLADPRSDLSGIRLSLGGPNLDELKWGLQTFAKVAAERSA